eukprot:2138703-Rhodomonas_salina.1
MYRLLGFLHLSSKRLSGRLCVCCVLCSTGAKYRSPMSGTKVEYEDLMSCTDAEYGGLMSGTDIEYRDLMPGTDVTLDPRP